MPAAHQPTSLVVWWTRFNDPILSDLINDPLVANTSIQSAQAVISQSQAVRDLYLVTKFRDTVFAAKALQRDPELVFG
jgi:outer membrane protein TolC